MSKFLFIDDLDYVVSSTVRFFESRGDFAGECCKDANSALVAIQKHQPEVVFFDHELSWRGDEGFEIARYCQEKSLSGYSISLGLNKDQEMKYRELGVAVIGKDIKAITQAIENESHSSPV